MLFKKFIAAAAAAALISTSAALPASAEPISYPELSLSVSRTYSSARTKKQSAKKPEFKSYTADADSITLKWKKADKADGYIVYMVNGKKASKAAETTDKTSCVISGLDPDTEYTFTFCPYTLSGGKKVSGKMSRFYTAVTAPSKKANLSGLIVNSKKNKVTLKWKKTKCSGYEVYAYSGGKWVKVKTVNDPDVTQVTFDLGKIYNKYLEANTIMFDINDLDPEMLELYMDDFYSFYEEYQKKHGDPNIEIYEALLSQGGAMGHRYAVRAFNTDSAGNGTALSEMSFMKDAYYDIGELKEFAGGEKSLKKIEKVLKKNYTGVSAKTYTLYTTSADDKGKITSSEKTLYISDADIKAIEKFSKEHFKSGWSDAEKLIYTINWINKNVEYDYSYTYPGKGYADNIFTYRKGQCDSYNGTIAEMLTYWGYKNVFLQCMTPSVRGSQHLRAAIKSGKKYYTFECGNYGKNGGWMWFFNEGLEVPLKN